MADTTIGIPIATAEMTALAPDNFNFVEAGNITFTPLNPYPLVNFALDDAMRARMIFVCIVTGDGNGLDDLVVPISGFSANVREEDPTYLSCKVPHGDAYEEDILARVDGDIVIKCGLMFADGSEYLEEIVRVDYEYAGVERTAADYVLNLVGHKTQTLGQSKEIALVGASYYSENSEGKRRIRGNVDFRLRCGDICAYGSEPGEEIVVGAITYSVAALPAMATMEVEEA